MYTKIDKVEAYLYDYIKANNYLPNIKLPSENTVCRILKVSRTTCRQAFDSLKNKGLIYKKQGSGTYVSFKAEKFNDKRNQNPKDTIALILPDLSSFFMLNIIEGIEKHANINNYTVMLFCSNNSSVHEMECITKAIDLGVCGIIIYLYDNIHSAQQVSLLKKAGIATVFLDAQIFGNKFFCVCSNNYIDVENASSHALHLGHKHIGIISPDFTKNIIIQNRIDGYRASLKSFKIPFHKAYVLKLADNNNESTLNKMTEYFKNNRKLSAVIVLNSTLCLKTIKVLNNLKKAIPKNISIIAYEDEFSNFIEHMSLKITTIKQNAMMIGETAIKSLLSIVHGYPLNKTVALISSEFIIRETLKSFYL